MATGLYHRLGLAKVGALKMVTIQPGLGVRRAAFRALSVEDQKRVREMRMFIDRHDDFYEGDQWVTELRWRLAIQSMWSMLSATWGFMYRIGINPWRLPVGKDGLPPEPPQETTT